MNAKLRIIGIVMLLLRLLPAHSQQISFNRIFPPEGKTFEHVTCMTQDKQGFLWIGTKRGIFRYDGYEMLSYKNNPIDNNSLSSDAIEAISVDSSGILWIGTANSGLDKFDPETGIFTHFRHSVNDPESIAADRITSLLVTRDGDLWVGTDGLDRYDSKKNSFHHYRSQALDSSSISCNEIVNIYEDKNRTVWIATGSVYGGGKYDLDFGGLNRFDRNTEKFTRFKHDPVNPNSLISNKVRAIFEDSKGNFWVGTAGDGLHIMDRAKSSFQRFPYDAKHPENLSRPQISRPFAEYDHITFIREDAAGKIWIGTTEAGINVYDPKTKQTSHYESQIDDPGNFLDRTAWTSFMSKDSVLWISSLTGTLYRIQPDKWQISFREDKYGGITCFLEETDGTFWMGTRDGGLLKINPATGNTARFSHNPKDSASIASNYVGAIFNDGEGRLWIGTENGLSLLNRQTGIFKNFRRQNASAISLSNNDISEIYEDSRKNLWLGTLRGLNRMDRATGIFQQYIFYPEDTSYIGGNMIASIVENPDGLIWTASPLGGGIHRININTGEEKTYLTGVGIVQMFKNKKDELWAGGNNLYRFDSETDSFYRFIDPSFRFELTNIRSLTGDDSAYLWVGFPGGILQIDLKNNETILYGKNFKVDGNSLDYTSIYKSADGRLFLGRDNGFYVFNPGQQSKSIYPPQIVLSDFRLANKLVKAGENSVLPLPLAQLKTIRLGHDQNVFSFDFAAIDFTNPEDNIHMFMLENYDAEWRQSGAEHRAYYFNVPPGEYVFRVKGANGYGVWAEKFINIHIRPPWWRTWWAYTLFGISFIALVWGFIYYRSRQLKNENKLLEEKVAHRTTQLEHSLAELKSTQNQLIQSEKMASLGELTAGIAHEIQNPLNFVNNFSDVNKDLTLELEDEIEKGNFVDVKSIARNIRENEEKINHHGKRADAIVKNMLQHSRSASGTKEPADINAIADEYLRLAYHGLRAKDKSFNATLVTDFDKTLSADEAGIGKINIIPQDIGRMLLNLYNNAFYAVHARSSAEAKAKAESRDTKTGVSRFEYQPQVSVTTKRKGNLVEIMVKDNGSGIPEKIADKIFQPFFTTKSTGEGTGLGLSLSYDILKAHGGEINARNLPEGGAEFTIILPANS